jgi:uncharacterized membrane protein
MAEHIDRREEKAEARALLSSAQPSPRRFFFLYLIVIVLIDVVCALATIALNSSAISNSTEIFFSVLSTLISLILGVGCYLYCMGARRSTPMAYPVLFNGFSFAGRIILLYLLEFFFAFLWSLLFVIPGLIAVYRYRFAVLNLCENPSLGVLQAIQMSKLQTEGYKAQLFTLDLSYLGFIILANLPLLYFSYGTLLSSQNFVLPGMNLSSLVQTLIADAIFLPVSLLYLPVFRTAEVGYFETAKRTSGIGAGMTPPDAV